MFGQNVEALKAISEAIGERVCLEAVYNGGKATLAPDSLMERHGELYLRAVRVAFDGRRPRQPKLGTFKVSGLTELKVTQQACLAKALLAQDVVAGR
jgi:hypothetical protein